MINPFKIEYQPGDTAEITCYDNFIVPNARSESEDQTTVACGVDGDWVVSRGLGFKTINGCVGKH